MENINVLIAQPNHAHYAQAVCQLIEDSAKVRGTGIAKRNPEYIAQKITDHKAIIALHDEKLVGFCYLETWSHSRYVANSGLIVHPEYRGHGLAKRIKHKAFEHARASYPTAKVFGITTSLAVMKINTQLGYHPVTFSELTQDDAFWKGCSSCPNYDILNRNQRKMCLCTAMLAPSKVESLKLDLSNQIISKV